MDPLIGRLRTSLRCEASPPTLGSNDNIYPMELVEHWYQIASALFPHSWYANDTPTRSLQPPSRPQHLADADDVSITSERQANKTYRPATLPFDPFFHTLDGCQNTHKSEARAPVLDGATGYSLHSFPPLHVRPCLRPPSTWLIHGRRWVVHYNFSTAFRT